MLKTIFRFLLGVFFVLAGLGHFYSPNFYLRMMPPYIPFPLEMVYLSGFFEITLGLAVFISRFRRLAGLGLILLLIAVFPANLHMAFHPELFPEISKTILYGRLPFQLIFILSVYWVTLSKKEK